MKCRTLETRATTAESHVKDLELCKEGLATRAEEAEKALRDMEVKCRMLETRATTAESRFEEVKNALKSSVYIFTKRYLEYSPNETTSQQCLSGLPNKRVRIEQPEEITEN